MKVFVSYTTKDPAITKEKLELVENRISPFADVFIDLLHNEKGRQSRVNRELRHCDVFLQLVSPDHPSEWVTKEVLTARKKGKTVIKVNVDELLAMDQEQTYLLLADVEKKGWSVWMVLAIALLACVGVSIVGIWLSYLFADSQMVGDETNQLPNARGLFGDSWGGVNAIISAFAFAGVIVTLFLQNRDVNLQRKEMARQREEFEKENETFKYQRFENLFYNMLNLQQELTRDLVIEDNGTGEDTIIKKGREVFPYFYEEMKVRYHYKNGSEVTTFKHILSIDEDYKKKLVAVRQLWFMDHYMRHLYRIFRFINDANEISDVKKREYAEIVRATLSPYELVFLYYIGFSHPRFKVLIEKYTLLNNLRPFLLAASGERDLVAKKFENDYTYEMDMDIDETNEYRKTAFKKNKGV